MSIYAWVYLLALCKVPHGLARATSREGLRLLMCVATWFNLTLIHSTAIVDNVSVVGTSLFTKWEACSLTTYTFTTTTGFKPNYSRARDIET